ncbi:ketopantoate reductase family protein [Effusibacillus dendaii]|uniref:2-dehydropantoate 2-reductase n=1 Tax=Effusibacillus dendaii TaxID=2743772 RepID=A0A7I8D7U5_9BACL|nr:2-dehydropantoate 2-reductase [Effusibacillus dendaii]BCJ86087.1 2-dehydropantoate 2-reductase [Effusibacillus dendaii]
MNEKPDLKIAVIGAGAIGKLVAARLAAAGFSIQMLVRRREQANLLNEKGVTLQQMNGRRMTVPVQATTEATDLAADLVILTVKSFDTAVGASQIADMAGIPYVLSLQNGLGNGEALASVLGAERVLLGITTYGATSLSDGEVAARGEGELVIGEYQSNSAIKQTISDLTQADSIFSQAGWNVRRAADMRKEIWLKALINIGINPLTAIHRTVNGEIAARPDLRKMALAAVWEAGRIAVANGILAMEDVQAAADRMLQVCQQTAANRSSMLQDIENGRPTEIDSLNGQIVQMGKELQIETPVNLVLTHYIKELQNR